MLCAVNMVWLVSCVSLLGFFAGACFATSPVACLLLKTAACFSVFGLLALVPPVARCSMGFGQRRVVIKAFCPAAAAVVVVVTGCSVFVGGAMLTCRVLSSFVAGVSRNAYLQMVRFSCCGRHNTFV